VKKKFCVIGLGSFGSHIVETLYNEGHEVTGIDINKDRVEAVKDTSSCAIIGDAANKDFLEAQGVQDMDAIVVSTGDRSHISTLIVLYLKELKVPRIIAKAISEDHGRILAKVGATDVIFPEKDMAIRVARNMSTPNILENIPLAEDYSLFETEPPAHFLGKSLIELDLRKKYQLTIIAIKDVLTDEFIAAPPPTHRLKDSDLLIILGKTEDIEQALRK